MSTPLYYLHHAKPYSDSWLSATKYRITTSHMLRIMDYYTEQRTLEELALEIVGDITSPLINDALLWNREHAEQARQAHASFHPDNTRIQPGLIVNGTHPWLCHTPDDLTWSSEGVGITVYKAPYSKTIPREPLPAHELQLCYAGAICEWSRPHIDYVVWTPSASAIKHYTPDTILVARENITLRGLWDNYMLPRLLHFHSTILQPLLATRNLAEVPVHSCPSDE